MPQEIIPEETVVALGAFLRSQREAKGLSLREATETTKISAKMLEAIEDDDYNTLPAEAFSRAFYSMYAEYLGLDQKEILTRYQESRGLPANSKKTLGKPPTKTGKAFSNFAEPLSLSPVTTLGVSIAALLIGIAAVCWYLNWNPATYVSARLQDMKNASPAEQQYPNPSPLSPPESTGAAETAQENGVTQDVAVPDLPTLPLEEETVSTPPAAAAAPELAPRPPLQAVEEEPLVLPAMAYLLEAKFNNGGSLQITLDDGFVIEKKFRAGETLQWEAANRMVLVMPEALSGRLRLNGIEIPLPEATDGQRLLSLPEDLLD